MLCVFMLSLIFIGTSALHAQTTVDFESNTIGDTLGSTGWNSADISAVVVDDPVSTGNNVLEVKINNYNASPYLEFVLPDGKTLADYDSLKFKGYFAQGDVGYKDISVYVSTAVPTSGVSTSNSALTALGSYNRAMGGSTGWENIGIDIKNFDESLSGSLYITFGISAAGTGNVGGDGLPTIWYADDVVLQAATDSTVMDVVMKSADHDTLQAAILAAGLAETLSGAGPFTLFAPTDAAFAMLPDGVLDELLANPERDLTDVLLHHVVGATALSTSLNDGDEFETLLEDSIMVTISNDSVFIDGALVTAADIVTDNGVVHVIDMVLEPAPDTTNVMDIIIASADHDTLEAAILASGLDEVLSDPDFEFTVFAPTDMAFAMLPDGTLEALLDDAGGELTEILLNHVVEGEYYAEDLTDGMVLTSLFEEDLVVTISNDSVFINGAHVSVADIESGNGLVHVVDGILLPPVVDPVAVAPVTTWARDGSYNNWPLIVDAGAPAGSASMGADVTVADGAWAAMRGTFNDVRALEGDPFVITGKLEIVGASLGSGYTPIRYALQYYDNIGTVENAGTDSAFYSGASSSSGYSFMPISGAGTLANGGGGSGTNWTINDGNWISTYSNNGMPIATVEQVPQLSEIVAGTYNFAISVEPTGIYSQELRWYLIHEDELYWFGGVIEVEEGTTKDFNAITFGFQGSEGFTRVNVSDVQAGNASQIEVPLPPFDDHYITMWGTDSRYRGFPVLRDSSYLAGDAGLGGVGVTADGWASLIGAFDYDVEAEAGDAALVISGEMTLDGSLGSGYTPLRFALAQFEDLGELENAYTDSAYFTQPSTNSSGYSFMPLSGAGTLANGNGGSGTNWWYANSNWLSTYGNNAPTGTFAQIPALSQMVAGTYEFEISVESIDEETNEVRFFMIHEDDEYYFAGSFVDTATTKTFNAIVFGFQGVEGFTQVDFEAVQVDKGDPIDIPIPAFYDHFIPLNAFGFLGGLYGGDWTLTPGEFVGDAMVSGSAATGWAAVRAGFEVPSTPEAGAGNALVAEGEVTFEDGGFEEEGSFLFGLFEAFEPGMVDSTEARGYEWNGSEAAHTGYLFDPLAGTVTAITDGVWYDAEADGAYEVASLGSKGTPTAGTYELEVSVQPVAGGMQINYRFNKDDDSFIFEASVIDDNAAAPTTFNGINFAIENSTTTGMAFEALEVYQDDAASVSNEDVANNLPTKFDLDQNYPNPFNPSTNIKFDLPVNADVQLSVYNMLGQKVMTLVNGKMEAGFHQVTFNAGSLASGMYIYRLDAGSFVSTKKMMLIK